MTDFVLFGSEGSASTFVTATKTRNQFVSVGGLRKKIFSDSKEGRFQAVDTSQKSFKVVEGTATFLFMAVALAPSSKNSRLSCLIF